MRILEHDTVWIWAELRSGNWELLDTQLGVPRTSKKFKQVEPLSHFVARTTAAAVALDAERILVSLAWANYMNLPTISICLDMS